MISTTKKTLREMEPGDRVLLQKPGEHALFRTVAVYPETDGEGYPFVRMKEAPELRLYLDLRRQYTVACPPQV